MIQKYEVEVLVKDNPDRVKPHYSSFQGLYRNWEERKMKHVDARTPAQAANKARKYGKVLSVRKHVSSRRFEKIEHIDIERTQPELVKPTFSQAIALDEMIWKKRNVRRKNMYRDKNKVDK